MDDASEEVCQPFLRWAGSKRRALAKFAGLCPEIRGRYIEPFVGSAALFFALAPKAAILGDLNKNLIRTYRAVANDPEAVHRRYRAYSTCAETYYRVRATLARTVDDSSFAAKFIYLNRNCFNGIYRTNSLGEFNVPFSGNRTDARIDFQHLRICGARLKRARLVHGDFERTIDDVRRGDFVYLDPPFATSARRIFVEYDKHPFRVEDLSRVRCWLRTIDSRGAKFLLSYAYCPEVLALSREWNHSQIRVTRNIAGFAGHRRKAVEILVHNL